MWVHHCLCLCACAVCRFHPGDPEHKRSQRDGGVEGAGGVSDHRQSPLLPGDFRSHHPGEHSPSSAYGAVVEGAGWGPVL